MTRGIGTYSLPPRTGWPAAAKQRYRLFGLSPADVEQILMEQGGGCWVCARTDPGGHNWCIDHCHDTNRVRFILCTRCNTALGHVREDPRIARRLYEVTLECQRIKRAANPQEGSR